VVRLRYVLDLLGFLHDLDRPTSTRAH